MTRPATRPSIPDYSEISAEELTRIYNAVSAEHEQMLREAPGAFDAALAHVYPMLAFREQLSQAIARVRTLEAETARLTSELYSARDERDGAVEEVTRAGLVT